MCVLYYYYSYLYSTSEIKIYLVCNSLYFLNGLPSQSLFCTTLIFDVKLLYKENILQIKFQPKLYTINNKLYCLLFFTTKRNYKTINTKCCKL